MTRPKLIGLPGRGQAAGESARSPAAFSAKLPILDDLQYRALANFRYALRSFLAFSEAATRAAGITPQQYQALLIIKASEKDEVHIRHLAAEMLLKHHGAVQLVDRLVRSKLIRRDASKSDGRAVSLRLTSSGERKLDRLAAIHFHEVVRHQPQLLAISRLADRMHRVGPQSDTENGNARHAQPQTHS